MFGEHVLAEWLGGWLGAFGALGPATAHGTASAFAVAALSYAHIVLGEMERLRSMVRAMQNRLLYVGLAGFAAVLVLDIPTNPVFDLSMRRHQLAGMLLAHLSVAAALAGLCSRRHAFVAALPRWPARIWLTVATLVSTAILALWAAIFHASGRYAAALARESGPLEPLQAGLYVVASWLAWQCACLGTGQERRLYRVASGVGIWLVLEEIEYFGLVETLIGGRIEGVWVRSTTSSPWGCAFRLCSWLWCPRRSSRRSSACGTSARDAWSARRPPPRRRPPSSLPACWRCPRCSIRTARPCSTMPAP